MREEEPKVSIAEGGDAVLVEGVQLVAGLSFERCWGNRQEVWSMLGQLPRQFMLGIGGGWSFLNACETAQGDQWGEHADVDRLICLGLALGAVEFALPREAWPVLPGGMPYFAVKAALG